MSSSQDVSTKVHLDKLNGKNYATWNRFMHDVFLTKSVWRVVNREVTTTFADTCIRDEYVNASNIAFGLMLLHMTRSITMWLMTEEAYVAWTRN